MKIDTLKVISWEGVNEYGETVMCMEVKGRDLGLDFDLHVSEVYDYEEANSGFAYDDWLDEELLSRIQDEADRYGITYSYITVDGEPVEIPWTW